MQLLTAPSSSTTSQDGKFRWNRLENLLQEGSKSSDFDSAQLWLLAEWLLSPGASGVRQSITIEMAKIIDATVASNVRRSIEQQTGSVEMAERWARQAAPCL